MNALGNLEVRAKHNRVRSKCASRPLFQYESGPERCSAAGTDLLTVNAVAQRGDLRGTRVLMHDLTAHAAAGGSHGVNVI